ncbi:MAG: alpha/beta hydrolase [Desulfobacteraceae bacterium]|nr:MAG: alpha/beta hydrolase [Desulfobacteraceae bacterium]
MESHNITIKNGITIHSLRAGSNDHPKLVLLHGYPSSAWLYRHVIPKLSGQFNIFVPDLPGHGKSDKPLVSEYTLDFFHDFLMEYFAAYEIEDAHLAAHDLGAMAAIALAVRNPELINRLVIMNTGPYADWPWKMKLFLKILSYDPLAPLFLTKQGFSYLFRQGLYDPTRIDDQTLEHYRCAWASDKNGAKVFSRIIRVPADQMVMPVEAIRNIDRPTLILWGKKDRFFPSGMAWRLSEDIPGAKLQFIQNAGHFLLEEAREETAGAIKAFLLE